MAITIVSAIAVAAPSVRAQAGTQIRGRVVDATGQPVVDAQIELAPSSKRTLSDDDGGFLFVDLSAGSYTVQVRRIGYQPSTQRVDVGARATATAVITLVAIPRVLDSIRVFAKAHGLRYTGAVLDDRSAPIEGAVVMVPGKARELRTDINGRFSVDGMSEGTVLARVRKIGFVPQLHSLQLMNEKVDTIRMKRLVQTLTQVQVLAQSGFGKDTFAYRDLDARMRWKTEKSYVVGRDEFDQQGTTDLSTAIRYSGTGGRFGGSLGKPLPSGCIIINGERALRDWPLSAFYADEVEVVEVYPPKSDPSGTIEPRGCDPDKPVYIIWMRANSKRFPPNP
jgi:Carboxypeptidase regulatory-like domain/CarboxypepD_reg-like domain